MHRLTLPYHWIFVLRVWIFADVGCC